MKRDTDWLLVSSTGIAHFSSFNFACVSKRHVFGGSHELSLFPSWQEKRRTCCTCPPLQVVPSNYRRAHAGIKHAVISAAAVSKIIT